MPLHGCVRSEPPALWTHRPQSRLPATKFMFHAGVPPQMDKQIQLPIAPPKRKDQVNQVSKISQWAPPDIWDQFEITGVPNPRLPGEFGFLCVEYGAPA